MNSTLICQRLDELAALSDITGEITRLYLSPAHKQAAMLVARWMNEAGLTTWHDSLGTVFGRLEGMQADAPTLYIGSHIDTVRNAGRYDGPLGVMLGLAVVERVRAAGEALPFAIEVVAFGDEEGVRFASALGSSRALAGVFAPALLNELDQQGISRREALVAFGCEPDNWARTAMRPNAIGYVEAHIEQGPVLEAEGLALGVVTAIAGCSRGVVQLEGVAGHAGTMPMHMRHDALAAAAEMVLAVERIGRSDPDLLATIGQLDVAGGAVNTVPGSLRFTLDVRSSIDAKRQGAMRQIEIDIARIAASRGIKARITIGYDAPAAPCDPAFMAALDEAVTAQGQRSFHLPSGAGHDGMAFIGKLPIAMLFVRSKGGISHNPDEYSAPEDIQMALEAMTRFVMGITLKNSSLQNSGL